MNDIARTLKKLSPQSIVVTLRGCDLTCFYEIERIALGADPEDRPAAEITEVYIEQTEVYSIRAKGAYLLSEDDIAELADLIDEQIYSTEGDDYE